MSSCTPTTVFLPAPTPTPTIVTPPGPGLFSGITGTITLFLRLFTLVGAFTVWYAATSVWQFINLHFIAPSQPLSRYQREFASPAYALITGASAGIGLGIATSLVKKGFGVVLLGHLPEELEQARASLERLKPAAPVEIRVMNAQTATDNEILKLVQSLDYVPVTILVNNVGGCPIDTPPMRDLSTYSFQDIDAVIDMNARFMAKLSSLMILLLRRNSAQARCRALILNLSSAGNCGLPWLTMYGATKAFNLALSQGISRELEIDPTNVVDCLAIVPADVVSQGNCKGVPGSAPGWESFGACIVRTVDGAVQRQMRELSPYWLHDLQLRILPWLNEVTRTQELIKTVVRKKDAWDEHFKKDE